MSDELVSIGAFARLSRLSVKRLRHYDELGLLEPAAADQRSGYRYYMRCSSCGSRSSSPRS